MRKTVVWVIVLAIMAGGAAMAQSTLPPGEVKDPNPPDPGFGIFVACPGPDLFGYTCDATVPFTAADISGTGTSLGSGDDAFFPVPLDPASPPFDYYGVQYTTLGLGTNGYVSTNPGDSGGDLSNDCPIPDPPSTGSGGRMYPLHDDLDLEAGIGVAYYEYFATCPRPVDRPGITTGCHVFQWDNVAHWPGSPTAPTWDQWAILYDTYDITFQVGPGNPEQGSGSTTGIQDPPAADGLLYACNSGGSIPDSFALTIFHPNPNLPGGACCLPDGSCTQGTEDECDAQGGLYQGDGTSCDDVMCEPVPTMGTWAKVGMILALVAVSLMSLGFLRRREA